jgi:hypothetical protein
MKRITTPKTPATRTNKPLSLSTFVAIISHVGLVTTTSTTKT